jgi:hypothetical protein
MTEEKKNEVESPSAPIAKALAEGNISLEKRIESVITEYVTKAVGDLEKRIDGMINAQLKAKEIEVEQALRKGLGLENDPVLHQSDMISFMRKAALEAQTESGKKTPATIEKAGPEGTKSSNPIDTMYDSFGGKA